MNKVIPKVDLQAQWSQSGRVWEGERGQRGQRGPRPWGDRVGVRGQEAISAAGVWSVRRCRR